MTPRRERSLGRISRHRPEQTLALERMEHAILLLRGHKVLMDTDLARLYGVETRTLRSGRPFWQRGYYEHVIRSESSLNRLRMYIADNPARWAFDRENPEAI